MILFTLGIQSQTKTSIQQKGGFHRKVGVEVREYFSWIERKIDKLWNFDVTHNGN